MLICWAVCRLASSDSISSQNFASGPPEPESSTGTKSVSSSINSFRTEGEALGKKLHNCLYPTDRLVVSTRGGSNHLASRAS